MDAWPDFPGLKVGKVNIFVLSDYLMTLIMNRDIVRSTIIPAMPLTVTVFSIAVFVGFFFTQSGFVKNNSFEERLQISPGFVPHNFICGLNNRIQGPAGTSSLFNINNTTKRLEVGG